MDLAALTWNGYKSCYYRTYCVGKEPTQEQKDTYETALKWLYDSIGAVKVGATTRDIAMADQMPELVRIWPEREQHYDVYLVMHTDLNRTARVRAAADAILESFVSFSGR